jgi:S-adenosyl methyltransferase
MSAEDAGRACSAAPDTSKPDVARVYDYWLGGKNNNFAADRAEAERLLDIYPRLQQLARENRLFLANAVTWAAKQGIGQFLDIGSRLPTAVNTHQSAQKVGSRPSSPALISCHRASWTLGIGARGQPQSPRSPSGWPEPRGCRV